MQLSHGARWAPPRPTNHPGARFETTQSTGSPRGKRLHILNSRPFSPSLLRSLPPCSTPQPKPPEYSFSLLPLHRFHRHILLPFLFPIADDLQHRDRMAESCSRKLVVEVCNAKNLMPKDGQGTASAFVLVDFDGQRRRTKTKFRDLNPQWDEKIEFLVHDPDSIASETLELNIYNDKKTGKRNNFLGKVKISGSSFQKSGSELLVYYPLEKRSVFSQIKGEIGLKIYYFDEDPPADAKPDAAASATEGGDAPKEEEAKKEEKAGEKTEEKKEEGKPADATAKEDEKPPAPENAKQEEEKKADSAPAPAPSAEKPLTAAGESKEEKEKCSLAKIPPDSGVTDVAVRPTRQLSSTDRAGGAYDLVERMLYLYVRVVKAKRPDADAGSAYAKMVIGTHSIRTRTAQKMDGDKVFVFHKDDVNPSWNADLVFVVAKLFEPFLVIGVEDVTRGQSVGHTKVPIR